MSLKRKQKNKYLFVAQDPGGLMALVPVVQRLRRKGFAPVLWVSKSSVVIASRLREKHVDCTGWSAAAFKKKLALVLPSVIVTGVSDGMSPDKRVIALARKNSIPVITLLDFWSTNYAINFSTPTTDDRVFLPTTICAIDNLMKRQMIEEGLPSKRIVVTGNPSFAKCKQNNTVKKRGVLFVCQPFTEMLKEFGRVARMPRYNEIEIFATYVRLLERYYPEEKVSIAFHPRALKRKKFDTIIKRSKLKITIASQATDLLMPKARLVLGINSAVLFRAALLGIPTISYQPGIQQKEDSLISNHLGLSRAAYTITQLEKIFLNVFKNKQSADRIQKIRDQYVDSKAIDRVIRVVNDSIV